MHYADHWRERLSRIARFPPDTSVNAFGPDPIVAVDAQDRILVGNDDLIYRFIASGKLDGTFGRRGRLRHPLVTRFDGSLLQKITAARDGKVVLCGTEEGFQRDPVLGEVRFTELAAPGGEWDSPENGTYSIQLRSGQIRDSEGNFAAVRNLGALTVNIPAVAAQMVAPARSTFPIATNDPEDEMLREVA